MPTVAGGAKKKRFRDKVKESMAANKVKGANTEETEAAPDATEAATRVNGKTDAALCILKRPAAALKQKPAAAVPKAVVPEAVQKAVVPKAVQKAVPKPVPKAVPEVLKKPAGAGARAGAILGGACFPDESNDDDEAANDLYNRIMAGEVRVVAN